MALIIITQPTVEPVSTQEFKDHHRVEITKDDTLVDTYIKSARLFAERFLRRTLINTTWELVLDSFPPNRVIHTHRHFSHHLHHATLRNDIFYIPRPPLSSVTSIKYTDIDGVEQTVTASDFTVDTSTEPGRVVPAFSKSWPATRAVINAVRLRFVAGYGSAATSVPEPIIQAIKLLASSFYENREDQSPMEMRNLPFGVKDLLWNYRVLNLHPLNERIEAF